MANLYDYMAHATGEIFLPNYSIYFPYIFMYWAASCLRTVKFCRVSGLGRVHESFWTMNPPASQKECRFCEVRLGIIILILFPPRSPLGNVLLNNATECKGWCMSPTTWVKYRANKAFSAVVILPLDDSTLTACWTNSIELTATSVKLMTGNTPSCTKVLHRLLITYQCNARDSTDSCYTWCLWCRRASTHSQWKS